VRLVGYSFLSILCEKVSNGFVKRGLFDNCVGGCLIGVFLKVSLNRYLGLIVIFGSVQMITIINIRVSSPYDNKTNYQNQ